MLEASFMLKSYVWVGGVGWVAHKILVSAPVPLELILTGFDWVGGWAFGVWVLGRGLTILSSLWYDSSYDFDPQLPRAWHGLHELLHRVQLQHHPRVLQDRWCYTNYSIIWQRFRHYDDAIIRSALSTNIYWPTHWMFVQSKHWGDTSLSAICCCQGQASDYVCIYYSLQSLSGIWRGSRRRSRQLLTRDTSELHNINHRPGQMTDFFRKMRTLGLPVNSLKKTTQTGCEEMPAI